MDSEYDYSDDEYYDEEENVSIDETFETDDDDGAPKPQEKNYAILTMEDIEERQQKDIKDVSDIFSISHDFASMLLQRYNWNVDDAQGAWVIYTDTKEVCKDVGLLHIGDIKSLEATENLTCGICFDPYSLDSIKTTGCGHPFCDTCWKPYISISINDGPRCLSLRCPDPSCGVAVGINMVNRLVSDEDREKYHHYLLRNYIEHSKKIKWCPAPRCDCAVEFDIGSENYDVSCNCLHAFCWNCIEEPHRPVACETVRKWIVKNNSESENGNWVLVNSKLCPKCKRPIEKNHGCMHMSCTPPCKFEFCWLCLDRWSLHGEKTGGYYACNLYEAAKKEGVYDETEHRREMAKKSLEKYTFFYERWAANQSSRKKALDDLNKMQTEHIAKFGQTQVLPETYFDFIIDAWHQIIECRRLLKWTYAYGYYLPDQELGELAKKRLFEFLQGQAEQCLEKLHLCAEKEVFTLLKEKAPGDEIADFRTKLIYLTSWTRTHFEKLVSGLENGLSEVNTFEPSSSNAVSSENLSKTSKGKSKKGKKKNKGGKWACNNCTHENSIDVYSCEICEVPRDT